MSVDSNEIDKILAEDDGETIENIELLKKSVNELLEPGPPYIFLSIESHYYVAGDQVEGRVLLDIPKAFENATLQIIAQGVEEVHIFSQGTQISQTTNKIFSLNTPMKTWEYLFIGNYILPFCFKLPTHCPGSFYYSGQDQLKNYIKAQVSYNLIVKLLYEGVEVSHSRVINVRCSKSRANHMVEKEENKMVKGCCFSNKGYSEFKLTVTSEDPPLANGNVKYKFMPNNSYCAVPINQVVAEVFVELEVVGKEKSYQLRQVVDSISRITWIAAYTSNVFEKDFEFSANLRFGEDHLNVSSIETSFIKCKYYIDIKVSYDSNFMREAEDITMSFHVNPSLTVFKETPALPSGWNAVADDVIKLNLENV